MPTPHLRDARCGHTYAAPARVGPPRKLCDECLLSAPRTPANNRTRDRRNLTTTRIVVCVCGAVRMTVNPQVKFCSEACSDVSRGVRLSRPYADRVCALNECDVTFRPYRETQLCCSERHGKTHYNRAYRAAGRNVRVWNDAARDAFHRRRAVKKGASTGRPVIRDEIAARDRYICGICKEKVKMTLLWPHPMSPSLDHIHPLQPADGSAPGLHDPSNVQLAHVSCNVRKNNKV